MFPKANRKCLRLDVVYKVRTASMLSDFYSVYMIIAISTDTRNLKQTNIFYTQYSIKTEIHTNTNTHIYNTMASLHQGSKVPSPCLFPNLVNVQETDNRSPVKGNDWRSMAEIYKKLTVGTSTRPTACMLERMNSMLPFSKATGIYDSGCGPGGVISRVISDYGSTIPPSASLSCSDFSGPMIEQVLKSKAEEVDEDPKSPWSRLDAKVRDAMDLEGVADESQSHVTAGWVYFVGHDRSCFLQDVRIADGFYAQMTPDPQKCLSESKRVLQPNGVLSCSSWKDSQWMGTMRLVEKVRPGIQTPSIPLEWASVPALQAELEKAGFREVKAEEVEVTMTFDTYDALTDVLLLKMPAVANLIKDFSGDERARLRELVLEDLQRMSPTEPGSLQGVALVVVGWRVPG